MQESTIVEILRKYFTAELTASEDTILQQWLAQSADNRQLFEQLHQSDQVKRDLERWHLINQKLTGQHLQLLKSRVIRSIEKPRPRMLNKIWPYAAIVAIGIGVALYFNPWGTTEDSTTAALSDIAPGANRATLTTADGKTLALSEEQEWIVMGEDIRYVDGSVISDQETPQTTWETDTGIAPRLLALATPKGGNYRVVLSDGTKVWLNAGSELKYPDRFTNQERTVYLEGEAYFEVKKDVSRPFRVLSGDQTVEVLGTAFNIDAYRDDSIIKTTLMSGGVKVLVQDEMHLLSPGHQAQSDGKSIDIQQVDLQQVVAWKNGKLSFTGKTFENIMNEVARWYDIEIQYEGTIPTNRFYGDARRGQSLSTVLRLLESADLKYRIDGRTLTIINMAI